MLERTSGGALAGALDERFSAVRRRPFAFLLETALPGPDRGAVSVAGSDPFLLLEARGRDVRLWDDGRPHAVEGSPWNAARALLERAEREAPGSQIVGWLGYDLGGWLERLPHRAAEDQEFPDLLLGAFDRITALDHATGRVSEPPGATGRPRALPRRFGGTGFDAPPGDAPSNFDRARYVAAVERAKELIRDGEIYQVNLSQRFAATHDGDPFELYRRLRSASPAPYAAYLEIGNLAVVSSSPEEFLRMDGRAVLTRPIKGTRPRGRTATEDETQRDDLLASAKDDAELVMIVDLERNDLGRIAEVGSVHVPVPKRLEAHPTVWHLVATVAATAREGIGPIELLENAFPGGSVTGAPKIRAMEIIDELEPTRRSLFTGAIAWMRPGFLRSSIAIRTMQCHAGHVTFQAGGAIVQDSDPAGEYEETLVKARAMAGAVGLSLG